MEHKEGQHFSQVIYLDEEPPAKIIDERTIPILMLKSPLEQLEDFLRKLASQARNCNACGGLTPELILHFNGEKFRFTCFEISSKKGVVAQTDYKKFGEWCSDHHGRKKGRR